MKTSMISTGQSSTGISFNEQLLNENQNIMALTNFFSTEVSENVIHVVNIFTST